MSSTLVLATYDSRTETFGHWLSQIFSLTLGLRSCSKERLIELGLTSKKATALVENVNNKGLTKYGLFPSAYSNFSPRNSLDFEAGDSLGVWQLICSYVKSKRILPIIRLKVYCKDFMSSPKIEVAKAPSCFTSIQSISLPWPMKSFYQCPVMPTIYARLPKSTSIWHVRDAEFD